MKRIKGKIVLGLTIMLLLLIWNLAFDPLLVWAEEGGLSIEELDFEGVDDIVTESGAEKLFQDQTQSQTVGELLAAVVSGEAAASWGDWAAAFGTSLWGSLQGYGSLMLQVMGLAMMSQCFSSLSNHFGENSAGEVGFLCVYGVMTLILMKSFQLVCQETQQTVEAVQKLSLYMMPAMAAVAVAAGFPVSSVFQGEALTGGFSLILTLIQNIFLTGVLWITVLDVVNCIGKREMLSQMVSLGRTVLDKGIKVVSVLYLMLMGIVGAVAPAADRLLYKVSGTLLSSVPVVGSALSGAMETVMAGSLMVKNGIGAVGCIVLLVICLIPIAKLTAFWLAYRLMAAFLAPLADERVIRLLSALGRGTALMLCMLVISMVIFTGVVGIMIVTLKQ